MQAMIARPMACRSPAVASQTTQAVRPRVLARVSRRSVLTRAEPTAAQKTLSELERAIAEARKQCDEATAGECAAAWDTVEELSAAISHKKAQAKADPLEEFCDDNPEADECRVYED
ncbi:CP12-domain-containing protein [Coccomyxa subellipsoidea C-169]|uniref:CP12-domain-containing protein n=1 Tax=Coccomyxa subellipsoidea (strain C-169) TaxID=574566 RepID=I0YN21_COCSC|nr:CP12-domain-containing protein [Coccomyxa subellipsoidea C-169]EIE19790.1 CP12-domain-containing protein [Coccomyxa subellipsoidea C-169]|eukprot:XP_005644334.1 CP12-domain-containing protein [Coccomyxa subellipsoidea C-169]